ncbi:apical junction molecule [Galendromus occidentalis]|uniref:Apical junction molecule n=1 Tax=Galendromus occidentalis TaxID=34638 RepID=A0AAJ6QMV5_9ACAR|nr:apical junction molecule [Galendromus occidentalis]
MGSATNEMCDDEPLPPGVLADDDDAAPPGVSASPPQIADENSQYSLTDSLSEPDSDGPPGAWDNDAPPGVEDAYPPPPPPPPPPKVYIPDEEMMEKLTYARVKVEFIDIMKQMPFPKEAYEALAASPSPNLLFRELIKKGLVPMPPSDALADLPPLEMFDDLEGSIYREGISSLVRHLLPFCEEDISYLTKVPPNAVPLSEIASQVFGIKKETPRYQIRIPSPEYQPPPIEERVPTPPPPPEPIPESRFRVKKLLEQKRLELARRKAQMKMTPSQLLNLKNSLRKQEKEELILPTECEAKLDESSQESETALSSRSLDSGVTSPDMKERRSRHGFAPKRSATPPRRPMRSPPPMNTKDRSSSSESSSGGKSAQKGPRDKIVMDKPIVEAKENGSLGSFSMKINQVSKGGMKDTLRKLSFGTEEEEDIERIEREKRENEEKKRKAAEEEAELARIKREKREARDKSKGSKKPKREREDTSPVKSQERKFHPIKKEEVQVRVRPLVPETASVSPTPPEVTEFSRPAKMPKFEAAPVQSPPKDASLDDPEAEEEKRLLEQMLKAQAELEKLKQRRLQQLQCKAATPNEPVSSSQEKPAEMETNAQTAQEVKTEATKVSHQQESSVSKVEKEEKKSGKKAKKKDKKSKKKHKKEKDENRPKPRKPSAEATAAVAKLPELDLAAFRDDELDHITDRTFKRHLRVPLCGIRYTLTEPSLKFSANLRHLVELTQIVDRERPVQSYVSHRLIENEVEPMDDEAEMEVSPVKTHNLIQINTIEGPIPYPEENFKNTLEDYSVNYQGNLLEVPIVCAAESTSSGNSPPTIPTFTSNAPQEQDSPESTTGPPKPCLSKTRRSNQPKSVSFFDGTAPEKDPLALSPPPPSQLLAERRKNRQRVSLLPPAAAVNAHVLTRQNLPPPPPPVGDAPVLYALDPINKQVYEILHPGNGIAITPGGVRSLDAQKYIYGEVVHTNETVLVENFLHLVYKFPYLINGESE